MSKQLIYAGIGSRQTPDTIIHTMQRAAYDLAKSDWLLRSGHAGGADSAFELGCIMGEGKKEIFLPWSKFNKAPQDHPDYLVPTFTPELHDYSAGFHPNWNACSQAAKLLHMRNTCQILGSMGDNPVDLVICWTKDAQRGGGTGQALRIAEANNIPIFDFGSEPQKVLMLLSLYVSQLEFLNQEEKEQAYEHPHHNSKTD